MSKIKFYTSDDQVYFEMEEQPMNKKQRIQELSNKIEKFQTEINELKEELEKLQKKPYKISYPKDEARVYYPNHFDGQINKSIFNVDSNADKSLYKKNLMFDTKEEAEQFIKEQTLIKKIKCYAKEQQGDWEPDWRNSEQMKHVIVLNYNELSIWGYYGNNVFSKLPYFKSEEIAQTCIDKFGDEILEVFC